MTEAVTTEELLSPKVTLLEFEKTTVPLVAVCVPAWIAPGEVDCEYDADAVSVEPFKPKLTLFELLNVNADARLLVVPALRLKLPWVEATVTDAVTTDELLIPNVTLLLFEKTTVPEVAVCVPA